MVIVVFRAWITIATRSPATQPVKYCCASLQYGITNISIVANISMACHIKYFLLRHICPITAVVTQWNGNANEHTIRQIFNFRYNCVTMLIQYWWLSIKSVQRVCLAGWGATHVVRVMSSTQRKCTSFSACEIKKSCQRQQKGPRFGQMVRSNGKTATIANQNITTCGTWWKDHTKWVYIMQRVIHIMDTCSKIWRNKATFVQEWHIFYWSIWRRYAIPNMEHQSEHAYHAKLSVA